MKRASILFLSFIAAGCLSSQPVGPSVAGVLEAGADAWPLLCLVVDEKGQPVPEATCRYDEGRRIWSGRTGPDGMVELRLPANTTGRVSAEADGVPSRSVDVSMTAPKAARLVLDWRVPLREPQAPRPWLLPHTIVNLSYVEAQLVGDTDGTLYYSAGTGILRSDDGGTTWKDITPGAPTAMPTLASDTAISIAPDHSVWFTRFWPYLGPTMGCTSPNRGTAWTCDNLAIVGPTDRMWIAGLDKSHGYIQAFHAFSVYQWSYTDSGSQRYTPHATTDRTFMLAGNIVYDEHNKQVLQIMGVGSTLFLVRIDGQAPLLRPVDTKIPRTQAIPWIVDVDGVLWTTGEPTRPDGGHTVSVYRSLDAGKTWDGFPVSVAPKSTTFSYVAAGPDGRVGVAYYGAPDPGLAEQTLSTWSLYVAETDNGLDANPTWVETRLVEGVHRGVICIGADCQATNADGRDPHGRYSLDMLGAWMAPNGDLLVAYSDDAHLPPGSPYHVMAQFVRQAA